MSNIDYFDIRTHIIESIVETFDTMLSAELEPTDTIPPECLEDLRNGCPVRFSGDATGMGSIHFGDHFTRQLAAEMLGMEVDEFEGDEEIKDMMGEVGNIVAGNLKSALTDAGLACALSTPSFTTGTDFRIESPNMEKYERFAFRSQDNIVLVEMGVKISEPVSQPTEAQPPDATSQPQPAQPAQPPPAAPAAQEAPPSPPADKEPRRPEDFDLDLLLDIPLELKVELGRSRVQIQELLNLTPGSAVKLVQLEGEPVDILANDTLIAKGEVVVQNEKYGIRVTEITSRIDRIRSFSI
jgi:flagellar motor switch protein FliN